MSTAPPWMPLYVGDYMKDTAHLTTLEHGAYLLLLMYCWSNKGMVPLHPIHCQRIAKMSEEEWKNSGQTILSFFKKTDDGYVQARLLLELKKSKLIINKRSMAGKASAKTRQHMFNTCSTHVQHMNQQSYPQSQSQSQEQKEKVKISSPSWKTLGEMDSPKSSSPRRQEKPRTFSERDCELIYQTYPKKVGHRKAIDKIRLALQKLLPDHPTDCISWLLERTKEYSEIVSSKDPQFIPYPSTWFHQERYNDDYESLRKEGDNGHTESKQRQLERRLHESSRKFLEVTQRPDEQSG